MWIQPVNEQQMKSTSDVKVSSSYSLVQCHSTIIRRTSWSLTFLTRPSFLFYLCILLSFPCLSLLYVPMKTPAIDHSRAICRKGCGRTSRQRGWTGDRDRLTRQDLLNKNMSSMRAKLLLFAVCPRRQKQAGLCSDCVLTGALYSADKEEEM